MAESALTKKRIGWRVKLEPRLDEPTRKESLMISLGAVAVALILGGVVIASVGGNPFVTYYYIARAAFGSVGVLSDTIVKATPIILTALPARRAASAWFAPLPPGAVRKSVPGTVSPGFGMRLTLPMRSRLIEPKTTIMRWP